MKIDMEKMSFTDARDLIYVIVNQDYIKSADDYNIKRLLFIMTERHAEMIAKKDLALHDKL